MEDNEKGNTLYIPMNIKTRFEFVNGFGLKELFITAIVTAISAGTAVIYNSVTQGDMFSSILIVLISGAVTGTCVTKNQYNQSVVDMIRLFIRFYTTQRKYPYKYVNRYGDYRE